MFHGHKALSTEPESNIYNTFLASGPLFILFPLGPADSSGVCSNTIIIMKKPPALIFTIFMSQLFFEESEQTVSSWLSEEYTLLYTPKKILNK